MNNLEMLKQELISQKEAIEEKGGKVIVGASHPSPSEITNGIKTIEAVDFKQTTATTADVIRGKTFYTTDGELKMGTYQYDFDVLKAVLFSDFVNPTTERVSFYIPTGVKVLRSDIFYKCPNPIDVYFNEDLEEFSSRCFYGVSQIHYKNFDVLKNLKVINSSCFYLSLNAENLLECLPDSLETVMQQAFMGTIRDGYSIRVPQNLKTIGNYAFASSTDIGRINAKELTFLDDFAGEIKGYIFYLVKFTNDFVTPKGTTGIGPCFNYRGGFKNITIRNEITAIQERAFGGLATDPVDSYILETVTFEGETPPAFGKNVFAPQNKTNNFKIYVPDNSVEEYKAKTNFTEFADYIYPVSEKL